MRLKAMQLELEVPEVPEGYGLVCAASGQYELGVGIEAEAVDLNTENVSYLTIFPCAAKTSAVCASTVWLGRLVVALLVSQMRSFWSSATDLHRHLSSYCMICA